MLYSCGLVVGSVGRSEISTGLRKVIIMRVVERVRIGGRAQAWGRRASRRLRADRGGGRDAKAHGARWRRGPRPRHGRRRREPRHCRGSPGIAVFRGHRLLARDHHAHLPALEVHELCLHVGKHVRRWSREGDRRWPRPQLRHPRPAHVQREAPAIQRGKDFFEAKMLMDCVISGSSHS